MVIRYLYNRIFEHADRMDSELPGLIKQEKWFEIGLLVIVSEDIWMGNTAKTYNRFARKAVENRDVETVKKLSQYIRKQADEMRRLERTIEKLSNKRHPSFLV